MNRMMLKRMNTEADYEMHTPKRMRVDNTETKLGGE